MFSNETVLTQNGVLYFGTFDAFGHHCELQLETSDQQLAEQLLCCIRKEICRLDEKYSNHSTDNILAQINRGTAESIIVDAETAALLDFADAFFELSAGRFDISCSAIQTAKFNNVTKGHQSWQQIRWDNPRLRLLQGMQLNLNSLTKAHAIDRALSLANEISKIPMLLSIGRIHLCNKPRKSTGDWWIEYLNLGDNNSKSRQLEEGAIVTLYSMSEQKDDFNFYDGRSNQAITTNPKAVTVAAANATEANLLATLAMLSGTDAGQYLSTQQVKYWIEAG